ncbi:hypothetical protein DAI22_02g025766 [Oryza sativa Japonica Group]|nr:hypothetical protein DAI22_02g025766 [Oryza sativa Japonica Group]
MTWAPSWIAAHSAQPRGDDEKTDRQADTTASLTFRVFRSFRVFSTRIMMRLKSYRDDEYSTNLVCLSAYLRSADTGGPHVSDTAQEWGPGKCPHFAGFTCLLKQPFFFLLLCDHGKKKEKKKKEGKKSCL